MQQHEQLRTGISRRGFLTGAAGIIGASTMPFLLSGCSSQAVASEPLSFMYWGSSYENQIIRSMLSAFSKSHGGADMQPMFTSSQAYNTKINTLVAANTPPDVAYMQDFMTYDLAGKGLLTNLYPKFHKYPQLADRLPSTYYFWDHDKCAGNQTGATAIVLYYNRDALKEAGVAAPPAVSADAWDWDTLLQAADRLTVDSSGRHPSEAGFSQNNIKQYGVDGFFNYWYGFVKSNGGDITNEDGTKYALDSPESVQALQNLQDLVMKHRVAPTPVAQGASGTTTATDFQTRRVGMAFDGTWTMLNLNQEKLSYGIGVQPKMKTAVTLQTSGATVIFNQTKSPEEALELYLYSYDPHNLKELFTSGLWLPVETKYFTNEADIAFWTDNANHPPEFRTAVIDALLTNSVTIYSQRLRNIDAITQVLNPAIDRISQGNQTAAEVCTSLRDQIQPLLKGFYPNPMIKA